MDKKSEKTTRRLILQKNGVDTDLFENGWIPASVLIAIADKEILWDDINTEYRERQHEAVLAYHESQFYDMSILKTLTTPIKVMAIRAFSLYAWHEQQGTEEEWLMEKIKKGYNRYVNYLQNTAKFNWQSLLIYIEEREPGISEMEKHDIMLVTIYLLGNAAASTLNNFYGTSILGNINQNFTSTALGDMQFRAERDKMELPGLRSLNKILGYKVPKSISFDQLIANHEAYLIKNVLTDKETKSIVDKDNYYPLYKKALYRYFKPLTAIMREMNFNDFNFLATADVSREELLTIYAMFETSKDLERLKDDEWEMYFVSSLLVMMMGKHYQQLSDFYLEGMKQEERLILETEVATQGKQAWEKEKEQYEKHEKELEMKLNEKDTYIEELERKLKQAQLQTEEDESLKKEVISLRNYAYQHQQDIQPEEADIVSSVTRLKGWTAKHKTVLFGGHPNTVNKLKTELPDMMFRDVDSLNRDLEFLQNQEVVFLITNYFNHPFYHKLMKELQDLPNTKLVYLTGYPNLERSMNEMWTGIQNTL